MANSKEIPGTAATASTSRGLFDVWLAAVTSWYLTGLLVALGFSFGFYLVRPPTGAGHLVREPLDAFTWQDGKWYKQIATEGYHYDPDARSNVAFFPVYPLLARAVIALTGLRAEVALLVVSNLSFLAALAMLAFYVRSRAVGQAFQPDVEAPQPIGQERLNQELGDWVLLAAALFPTGCFFRLAYSESTCLLLTILAMFAMRRRWPLWSIALTVGLATAARPVGVALLAPLVIHIAGRGKRCKPEASARNDQASGEENEAPPDERITPGASRRHGRNARRLRFALVSSRIALYLPLACWGLLAFMAYQYVAFGDPLAVFKAHGHWRIREPLAWPEKAAALLALEPLRSVFDAGSPAFWASYDRHSIPWFSLQFANPVYFLAAVALMILGAWRRWLTLEEVSLGALLLLIPYCTRAHEMGMGSMGRFVAIVFPMYLVLGRVLLHLPPCARAALLALSGYFLATYTALYAGGYQVF